MKRVLSELSYWDCRVPEDVMDTIRAEIWYGIGASPLEPYNSKLAGNIDQEYKLEYSRDCIENFVKEQVWAYKAKPSQLTDVWCNLQDRYEFNPPHSHGGDLSFVIFFNIPYMIENEMQKFPNVNGGSSAGHFSFLYTGTSGGVVSHMIPVDERYNGTMFLFPASLKHCVYPFYTSDDYRITVAGNLIYA